jgi:hypothetical protein
MAKMLTLLFTILLAIASVAGYVFLDGKISAGKVLIADGQVQLDKGQVKLEEGKGKLEAGKQELSDGKVEYAQAEDNVFLVLGDFLFKGGKGFREAREQIAAGDKQVAQGENKIEAGEKRLDAGELQLKQGVEQLGFAKGLRAVCTLGAFIFTALALVLGLWWRRSLAKTFKHIFA